MPIRWSEQHEAAMRELGEVESRREAREKREREEEVVEKAVAEVVGRARAGEVGARCACEHRDHLDGDGGACHGTAVVVKLTDYGRYAICAGCVERGHLGVYVNEVAGSSYQPKHAHGCPECGGEFQGERAIFTCFRRGEGDDDSDRITLDEAERGELRGAWEDQEDLGCTYRLYCVSECFTIDHLESIPDTEAELRELAIEHLMAVRAGAARR